MPKVLPSYLFGQELRSQLLSVLFAATETINRRSVGGNRGTRRNSLMTSSIKYRVQTAWKPKRWLRIENKPVSLTTYCELTLFCSTRPTVGFLRPLNTHRRAVLPFPVSGEWGGERSGHSTPATVYVSCVFVLTAFS